MTELVVTTQQLHSGGINMSNYPCDPVSLEIVNRMPAVHKSSKQLTSKLQRTIGELSENLESIRTSLHSNISYEQFMADMLYGDEVVLANQQFLQYDYVTFEVLSGVGPILSSKKNLTRGRCFLTNRRLIMLSNEGTQGTHVAPVPEGVKKPTKYSVKCEAGDAISYQYLPLKAIRTVEFDAIIGASMMTFIDSDEACCLWKWFSCFGAAVCRRTWNEIGRTANPSNNERVLKLSVDLPPWGNPCIISIHVQPQVNLLLVKDFLRDLQSYGPEMRLPSYAERA